MTLADAHPSAAGCLAGSSSPLPDVRIFAGQLLQKKTRAVTQFAVNPGQHGDPNATLGHGCSVKK